MDVLTPKNHGYVQIAKENIRDSINYLELYNNRGYIPPLIYNSLKNSLHMALESASGFRYKILIIGLINSGKSTFVNTILGKFIIPTSTLENTRWPVIIRNSESDIPKLYSSKLTNNYIYEFNEDRLLAEGDDKVREYFNFINVSKEMDDEYKNFQEYIQNLNDNQSYNNSQTKRVSCSYVDTNSINENSINLTFDDEVINSNDLKYSENNKTLINDKFKDRKHCQFIFILRIKIKNLNLIEDDLENYNSNRTCSTNYKSSINKVIDTYELWDIPGLNSINNFFNDYILKNLIENENLINKAFPFINTKRIFIVYLSEYSTFNQIHNHQLWDKIKSLSAYCNNIYFIINKIDLKCEEDSNILYKNVENEIEFLELVKMNFHINECNINYYTMSALYSFIENCEKNKSLDNNYWNIKEKIYETNQAIKKEFKTFDKFRKFTIARVQIDDDPEYEFLPSLDNFLNNLITGLKYMKNTDNILSNNIDIIKMLIFDLDIDQIDICKKETKICFNLQNLKNQIYINRKFYSVLDGSIYNIENIFSLYFKRLKHHMKIGLKIIDKKIEKHLNKTRNEIDTFLSSISLYSEEKFKTITEYYKNILEKIISLKCNFKFDIENENENLVGCLKKELSSAKLNLLIINFFIDKIKLQIENDFKTIEDNIELKSSSLLKDIGLSLSDGMIKGIIAFMGTNIIQNVISVKTAGTLFISTSIFSIFISAGFMLYCSWRQMDNLNSENKDSLIKQENKLWKYILRYKEDTFDELTTIVSKAKKNNCMNKNRINGFFSFVKKTLKL